MKTVLSFFISIIVLLSLPAYSQPCTTSGDQTTYGTGNIWIGYLYDNTNFTTYRSYVNEGTAGSANFDESFGGDYVNYTTTGCFVYTETFSARYKLIKNFAAGNYEFTVGGDDGFRLSLDGGATWFINQWNDQGYTTTTNSIYLSGNYNLVLEYYENAGNNRLSFQVQSICTGTENQATYGTGNVWRGYVYDGTNFNTYKGLVTEGTDGSMSFDQSFGGDNVTYATSACGVQTETFSVRYRLRRTFAPGNYIFIVGGDDGYRLSLDGGATWVINRWSDQSYNVNSYAGVVSGTHDMVIEYYENGGGNRISFSISGAVLPINLINFTGERKTNKVLLDWLTTENSTTDYFEIERSTGNNLFSSIGKLTAEAGIKTNNNISYQFTDNNASVNASDYRLKMVDISGTITYSKTISLLPASFSEGVHVYPTVSQGNIFITSAEKLRNPAIELFDVAGRRVFSKNLSPLPAKTPVAVSVSRNGERKGVYFLRISDSNLLIDTKKIILQ